jgi:transcriptional regulator with XRE-family HTH domain
MIYKKQMRQFGAEVKRLRLEKEFTQEELASRSDVDVRTIQRIEAGGMGPKGIPLNLVFSIVGALEISLLELMANIKVPKTGYVSLGKAPKPRSKKKKK